MRTKDEIIQARKTLDITSDVDIEVDKCLEWVLSGEAEASDAVLSEVRAFLEKTRRRHHECEDSWYSCPKSEDGCSNYDWGDECNCGADKYNAELDEILKKISEHLR